MNAGDRQLLTNSRAKCARACLRKQHIEYELGYRPLVESESLVFGRVWHVGMEGYWGWLADQASAGPFADAISHLAATIGSFRAAAARTRLDPYAVAKAEAMLEGYVDRWSQQDRERYEVVAVEAAFRAPLINPATGRRSATFDQGGKVDLIVRDLQRDGELGIGEHKTANEDISHGSAYWQRVRIDSQISIYYGGARSLGFDPVFCLYDVAAKPSQRPLKRNQKNPRDESPDEYRQRCRAAIAEEPQAYYVRADDLVRLDAELQAMAADTWQWGQIIREGQAAGIHPRNPDSCRAYGRECEYLPVCMGSTTLDDPTKYRRLTDVHPELATEEVSDGF